MASVASIPGCTFDTLFFLLSVSLSHGHCWVQWISHMKCAKLSVSRWKFWGITTCKGCQNEAVKTNEKSSNHMDETRGNWVQDIIKTTHSRWYGFLQKTIKVWQTPLKMMCFCFPACDSTTKKLQLQRVGFQWPLIIIQDHHLFFNFTSVVWQFSSSVVSRWRFWSSLAMLAMFSTRPGFGVTIGYPMGGWVPRIDFHRKAQQKMAPWYFSMAKVASQT